MARYAAVSGDGEAAALARTHARLVHGAAHDAVHGGYFELFTRDWRHWTGMERHFLSEVPAGTKRYNTHLHWFEALVEYVDLLGGQHGRAGQDHGRQREGHGQGKRVETKAGR